MILSIVIVIVVLAVELPFSVLAVRDFRAQAIQWAPEVEISWAVILGIIIVLNLMAFGWISYLKVLQFGSSSSIESNKEMFKILTRIQVAAVYIIISCACSIASMFFFGARSQRGVYSDPRCFLDGVDIAYRLSTLFFQFSCAVAIWFIAPSIRGARQGSPVSRDNSLASPCKPCRRLTSLTRKRSSTCKTGDLRMVERGDGINVNHFEKGEIEQGQN